MKNIKISKKMVAFLLAGGLTFSLASCGINDVLSNIDVETDSSLGKRVTVEKEFGNKEQNEDTREVKRPEKVIVHRPVYVNY